MTDLHVLLGELSHQLTSGFSSKKLGLVVYSSCLSRLVARDLSCCMGCSSWG